MKKSMIMFAFMALAILSCQKEPATKEDALVRIEPVITRATAVNFEEGDRIGLTIVKAGETFAENACLTYSETSSVFSGDLRWYADGGETSTLTAFYPYSEDGIPSKFTVGTDQSEGAGAYDFMMSAKENVYPQAAGVAMVFQHYLTQLTVTLNNECGAKIEKVTIKNVNPSANISVDGAAVTVTADPDASPVEIIAEELQADSKYRAIVVPQTATIAVSVAVDKGSTLTSTTSEVELKSGYTYNIAVKVAANAVSATVAGEIAAWEDGGEIGSEVIEPEFEEHDGWFKYHGVRYNTVTLSNGQTWMMSNLCYVPKGLSIDGVDIFYPYKFENLEYYRDTTWNKNVEPWEPKTITNKSRATVVQCTDDATIKANGLFYTFKAIYGEAISSTNYNTLEGAQGICPEGWHIPTLAEWLGLCGKTIKIGSNPAASLSTALFYDTDYDGGNLKAMSDAMGLEPVGCYSGKYNETVLGSNKTDVEAWYGKPSMSYWACSTGASATQMAGLMTTFIDSKALPETPPTNPKGKVSLSLCNATYATAVRCVKNAD